jgi:5-methylcytosine-specific restriction endonuclease McrA
MAERKTEPMQKAEVIAAAYSGLSTAGSKAASAILDVDYPFAPEVVSKRRFRPLDYTRVFIRDGFMDRYIGERLVFPPVLRMLSYALPERFPFQPNWKTQVTHPAYWEVGATIDHLIPVTRGGVDEPSNWVTTSMARNSAKMNWMLSELGWELRPPGDFQEWDGLLGWCLQYASSHPDALDNGLRQWLRAGSTALTEIEA